MDIEIVPYDPSWKTEFTEIGQKIREVLGDTALRIYHIGSTSVEGLAAKPIIDIQVSVRSWNNFEHLIRQFNSIGYVHRADNPDKTKRYFREAPGGKRTHIHVRELGSWAEQFPLLFRDYLRCHTDECELYAAVKYELMKKYQKDRHGYVDAKEPIIWDIMRRASSWSQEVGWRAGETDV
ncbi:GrpB family protein [Paenibacillus sp. chi10]|uniref:GrpB family protein n=1 Tax=Paenibacillus suaedae TaxID=3077233 RepID=A0AAJ2N3X2_9BACL|nr:GrpB family protein [Paenibacillus sp. chi10]MDT8976215.1 GrpB family protein [Paenibacillus sp. chi10]